MGQKHKYNYILDYINSNSGYELLSEEYSNQLEKLEIKCPEGHIFPMGFKEFKKGHRCSYCANKRQYNIEEVKKFFKEEGYTLISKEYKGNKEKLEVLGPDNKVYTTTLFLFKVNGVRPHLKGINNITENSVREIIESLTGKSFPNSTPDWLINPNTGKQLTLDGYNDEMGIAFEYDGQQHFHDKVFSNNVKDCSTLEKTKDRDLIKEMLLKERNIKLIRIPYYIKNKKNYIEGKLNNKILTIGDPHCTSKGIDEMRKLVEFAKETCFSNSVSEIVILGDMFHNHGIIDLKVLNFWNSTLIKLSENFSIKILVGNHDMIFTGDGCTSASSINILKEKFKYTIDVIDKPFIDENGIGYLPYIGDVEKFKEYSDFLYKKGAKDLLFCHETVNGAKFENGMYAPEGIPMEYIRQNTTISGHIHARQCFGKIIYPGTARWLTKSDANREKGLTIYTHNGRGKILDEKFINTDEICTPIKEYVIEEGTKLPKLDPRNKNYVTLKGSAQWANTSKKKIKDQAIIKIITTDKKVQRVEMGENINIDKFINDHVSLEKEVTKQEVIDYIGAL